MTLPTIALFVQEEGAAHDKTLVYDLFFSGRERRKGRRLSPPQSREVRELAKQAAAVFEQSPGKEASDAAREIMGEALFRLWFREDWETIQKEAVQPDVILEVFSEVTAVLALPWELLKLPGLSHRVRRNPGGRERWEEQIAPGPLRVLIAACSPTDLPRLESDAAEEDIMASLHGLDLFIRICEQGSFDELADLCGRLRPHLLHLVGHCGERGFACEDEGGRSDWQSASQLAGILSPGSVLLIQGRDMGGLARLSGDLIAAQARAVLAAGAALGEMTGQFLKTLYQALARGECPEDALVAARPALADDPGLAWAIPQLYGEGAGDLFDRKERQEPTDRALVQLPLPGMSGGYAAPFLGRRRMLQRLLPALRDGTLRLLILTGPPGSGRSALACRLVRGLGARPLIAVQAPFGGRLTGAAILEACRRAFQSSGSEEVAGLAARMDDPSTPPQELMAAAVDGINAGGFVLVADGLVGGRWADPVLTGLLSRLQKELKSGRAVICADRLPPDLGRLGPSARSEWMGEISDAAFQRYMQHDGEVARRLRQGRIPTNLLQQIPSKLGRRPDRLEPVRARLARADPGDLVGRLNDMVLPADLHSRQSEQDKGFGELILQEATDAFNAADGRALARSAALPTSATTAEMAAVAGCAEAEMARILDLACSLGLAHPAQPGWSMLNHRDLLLEGLPAEERREALEAAGEILAKRRTLVAMIDANTSFALAGRADREQETFRQLASYLLRHGMQQDLATLSQGRSDPESLAMSGAAFLRRGELDSAVHQLKAALEGFRQAGDCAGQAAALHHLGSAALRQGQYGPAREHLSLAASILESLGDRASLAATLHNLALAAISDLDLASAQASLNRSLQLLREVGDRDGQAQSLQTMARIALAEKQDQQAAEWLKEALAIFQETGDQEGQASAMDALASLDIRQERWSEARDRLLQVLEILNKTKNTTGQAASWHNLATVQQQLGDRSSAQKSLRRALAIQTAGGDKEGEAASIFQLGVMAVWEGKMQEGLRLLAMAAMILRSTGSLDLKQVEPMVENLAAQLKVSPEQFMTIVGQVVAAYRRDHGQGLIEEVFGPLAEGPH